MISGAPGRRRRARIVAATAVAVLAAAGCSSVGRGAPATRAVGSTTSTGAGSTTTSPPTLPSVGPTLAITPTTISPPGPVGTSVYLPATGQSAATQVTLLKVVDPAPGADQFAVPVAGGRFVAAQFRITTASDSATLDAGADTVLDDSQGNLYSPTNANVTGCSAFGTNALSPGSTSTGCLTFEIPVDAAVSEITFTPSGEFGSVSAEWLVP